MKLFITILIISTYFSCQHIEKPQKFNFKSKQVEIEIEKYINTFIGENQKIILTVENRENNIFFLFIHDEC